MSMRRRPVEVALPGCALIVLGFLSVVASYFLLPYAVVGPGLDITATPTSVTAWEVTVRVWRSVAAPYDLQLALGSAFALLLVNLPLLAAMVILGWEVDVLVHPHRTFVTWSGVARVVGIAALLIQLPFFIFARPGVGYVGMLVGYGLLWGGSRLLRPTRLDPVPSSGT